jgi:hypothetical protein
MLAATEEETKVGPSDYQSFVCTTSAQWALLQSLVDLAVQAEAQIGTRAGALDNIPLPSTAPRDTFKELVAKWRHDTDHISSITKTVMDPSYQQIMGMGPPVVPLILEELRDHGGHWFWALRFITRQNPADGCIEFDAACRAWLKWGRSEGYIR